MGYKVKLNVFEGPFDLLVYLIENAQMSIYDIKISEITDQYLEYVKEIERQDVSAAAEFMVLAASLLEIKSKMLLPRLAVGEEGAASEDPRSELVEKLLEYKRFKLLAEMLREKEDAGLRIMEKPQEDLSVLFLRSGGAAEFGFRAIRVCVPFVSTEKEAAGGNSQTPYALGKAADHHRSQDDGYSRFFPHRPFSGSEFQRIGRQKG